ncbi:MAG: sigma-70 family RNA polymerase sigma factor, partial [Hyphomonas sp.]|nr:sigma-70 family RNA polymerase sigma factor [Hyphomonas sp.]
MAFTSDLDQITRAAAGDPAAVRALVNRYSPGVLSLATRMLADRAEAEDVTQETFLRAWKALPGWEPRAKFSTWLHRVALNLCYDRLRKRKESLPGDLPDHADTRLAPHDALDQSQRVTAIEHAIGELPERQSAALTL